MKTIIRILFLGLLLSPMCAFAQNATEQREERMTVQWEDLDGISDWISYNVPIYYDENDNVIKHGLFKINYKRDLTAKVGQKCIISYNVSGNYVNGKLDGVLSVEEGTTIKEGSIKTKGTLYFANGVPVGTWTISEIGTIGNKSETKTCSITIKDDILVSYNDGENNYKLNSDGTFSGTLKGDVYKKSINTNKFVRKTGEITKPDATAQSLINAYIAGTMSESDLITKGFAFTGHRWIYSCNFNNLRFYYNKLDIGEFSDDGIPAREYTSDNTLDKIIKSTEEKLKYSYAYTLKRANIISTEELIAKASTLKNAKEVSESADEIKWSDNNIISYIYEYGTNQIYISNDIYNFTDEAKSKLEETIKEGLVEWSVEQKRIAEEERIEQERIAEEKRIAEERLQALEKLKKQVQPICDYLISAKTSTSVSYGDQVNNYFNPEGLGEYWQLNLGKAIKPFCKIIDCKIFSCKIQENAEGTILAVLDITKYNKKGNITYRVPITIVNGKVLVTSIDFSNATVVE